MKIIFNTVSLIILIVSSISYLLAINISNGVYLVAIAIQTILFIRTGLVYKKNLFTSWANPIYILLASLLIVNFQTLTNVSLGFGRLGDYMFGADKYGYLITPCLAISVASMSCFMLVVINYRNRNRHYRSLDKHYYTEKGVNLFLVLAFIYFIATINIRDFLTGAVYHGSGASDIGVVSYGYSERFLDSFIFIALAVYTYNIRQANSIKTVKEYISRIPIIFWIVVGSYLLLRLFSGDRGPVIYTLFAILYSCIYCINLKIRLIPLLALAVGGAFVMALISYARAQSSDISFSEKMRIGNSMLSATEVYNISPLTQDLAASNICTLIMIDDINRGVIDYKYGTNAISSLINCIPFMGVIKAEIPFPDFLDVKASTTYITESANGGRDYDSGYGSTLIADYYYDLGFIGCLLGFLLLGFIYMRLSSSIVEGVPLSVISLIYILKMASLSIYIPRSTMWASIGSTVFIIIIYCLLSIVLRQMK